MHIALAGHFGSGKSTLAKALAADLGAVTASFGGYIRELATETGLEANDRSVLQNLGQKLATQDPLAFLGSFLSRYSLTDTKDLIFDGVRHIGVWNAIAEHARSLGVGYCLVFVDTASLVRRDRLRGRGHSEDEIAHWSAHKMEQELVPLKAAAALVLDGAASIEDLVKTLHATAGVSSD
jgi:dephospho-CoA kinase